MDTIRGKFFKQHLLSDQFLDLIEKNKRPMDELMSYYQCAILEVETKFKVLNQEYSLEYDRNPIEGITLHKVKTIPKGAAEEVARKCIEINSCKYFTFKQMLKKMDVKELPEHSPGTLPNHENIRGKDYYK